MTGALYAVGRACVRRRWLTLLVWLAIVGGIVFSVARFGSQTSDNLSLPGTDSQRAFDLLAERFPPRQNGTSPIIFSIDSGKLTEARFKTPIKSSLDEMRATEGVFSVIGPYSTRGASQMSGDKRIAFASVLLSVESGNLTERYAQELLDETQPARRAGVEVEAGGVIGSKLSKPKTETSDAVGLVAAMIFLSLAFGTIVAMGLPIITALLAVAAGVGAIGLLGHVVQIPSIAPTLATMIGLGVGIDYALFILTRHRTFVEEGVRRRESVARAVATSGGAIVFAGGTVVIALASLSVAGIPLVSALGYAAAGMVLIAVLGAVTLLPSLLSVVGRKIDSLRLPQMLRPRNRDPMRGKWAQFARLVAKHPLPAVAVALALLVPLMIPALSLELGQEDVGVTPTSTTERRAYDLMTAGFGVGYNGPLLIANELQPDAHPSQSYENKLHRANSLKRKLKREQKSLEKKSKELKSEQRSLENQERELEDEEAALQAEGSQLTIEEVDLEAQQSELEREATRLNEEEAALRGDRARLERQSATLERQEERLRNERSALERQSAELRREQASLERQKRRLQRKQAALERQQTELRREEAALGRRQARLEQEARQLAREARPLVERLAVILAREQVVQDRIDRTTNPARLMRLRNRLDRLRVREQEVRDQLAPLERGGRRLAREERALEAEAAELNARAQELRARGNELQAQADSLQIEGSELQQQANALKAEGRELRSEAGALRSKAAELSREAQSLQARAAGLETQARRLRAEGDELRSESDLLQAQADELQSEAASLQAQGHQLQQEADGLQTKADRLKKQEREAKKQRKEANKLKRELTKELTKAGGDQRGTDPRLVRLQNALTDAPDADVVSPPIINKSGDAAIFSVIPFSAPSAERTTNFVTDLRSSVIPKATAEGGITSYVGGQTASNDDLAAQISDKLLLVILVVLALSFIVLLLAFRSVAIPLKAVIMNLLSVTAAYGVLTACFQWGWAVDLIGLDATGGVPIASYVPLMMFAVLFGLSMDYEVFLMSQIQEHHDAGKNMHDSVVSGLSYSARVITTAALIMVSVFSSFILNGDPVVKQFGVGLSVAVALDATIVRVLLVPAALVLLGEGAWWLPRWLDRLVPKLNVEGSGYFEERDRQAATTNRLRIVPDSEVDDRSEGGRSAS
jgi:uncharacterized membrane protein YdfJ with MMPL/SSD domain